MYDLIGKRDGDIRSARTKEENKHITTTKATYICHDAKTFHPKYSSLSAGPIFLSSLPPAGSAFHAPALAWHVSTCSTRTTGLISAYPMNTLQQYQHMYHDASSLTSEVILQLVVSCGGGFACHSPTVALHVSTCSTLISC